MRIIIVFILILILPALSFAAVQTTVSCGTDLVNKDVKVLMRYTSTINVLMATSATSISLPETGGSSFAYISILGRTNASGQVLVTQSSGSMLFQSCSLSSSDDEEFSFNLLMGFAGALCAWMLFYSILSAFLN